MRSDVTGRLLARVLVARVALERELEEVVGGPLRRFAQLSRDGGEALARHALALFLAQQSSRAARRKMCFEVRPRPVVAGVPLIPC